MAKIQALIEEYSRGAALLLDVITQTPADAWDTKPIPGTCLCVRFSVTSLTERLFMLTE